MGYRLLLAVVTAGLLAAALLLFDPVAALEWIESTGPWAPLVFGALYAVGCMLLLPAAPPALAAGVLFGLGRGCVVVSLGSTAGAAGAFLLGRRLGRGRVEAWLGRRPRWRAIDRGIAEKGALIVLLTRLSPILPFGVVNVLFGISRVGFWPHLLLTWLGSLPGVVLYVWLGSALGRAALGKGGASPAGDALFWVGLAATLLLTLLLARIARQQLPDLPDEDAAAR